MERPCSGLKKRTNNKRVDAPVIKIGSDSYVLLPVYKPPRSGSKHNHSRSNWNVKHEPIELFSNNFQIGEQRPTSSQLYSKPIFRTLSSRDFDGDVQIAEICIASLAKNCKYEKIGCKRLHAFSPYHWQFQHENKWRNFLIFISKELEQGYQNPELTTIALTQLSPNEKPYFKNHLTIFGNAVWNANFESLSISDTQRTFSIRRVSSASAAVLSSKYATVYEWYFEDPSKKWIKYGQVDSLSRGDHVPSITSDDIEKMYCNNPQDTAQFGSSKFKYTLEFKSMMQTNLSTNTKRPVRRRPKSKPEEGYKLNIKGIPKYWCPLTTDPLKLFTVTVNSTEYNDIETLVKKTGANIQIRKIERVQNTFLWQSFNLKCRSLNEKSGTTELKVERLFHGTDQCYVKNICEENFDWRLHGTRNGNSFGRGSYFTNNITTAKGYCGSSSPCSIFVVRVIIGTTISGSSGLVRPPVNPINNLLYNTTVDNEANPSIFVKYDSQEYYPEYILEVD